MPVAVPSGVQFRVKANSSAGLSDDDPVKLSDQVAFEHLSLICDGPVLQLYQHIMDGSINWHVPQMSTEVNDAPGSHPAPSNWSELKTALLDCLMPSNSVEESVRLATFKKDLDETAPSRCTPSATSLNVLALKRVSSVQLRAVPRMPLSVVLFRNGVVPGVKLLASHEPYHKTLTDAVAQLRRLEAVNFTGLNPGRVDAYASAMSFTYVPNRTAIAQQFVAVDRRSASGGARVGGAGGFPRSGRSNRPRPKCTYPGCRKPMGHTTDRCLQKQRKEAKRAKDPGGGGGSGSGGYGGGGSGGGGKRPKKSDN